MHNWIASIGVFASLTMNVTCGSTTMPQSNGGVDLIETQDSLSIVETVPEPAANNLESYLPDLKGKSIGVLANQTSLVDGTHLVDTLYELGVDIVRVFGPEHGFRGNTGAGDAVNDEIDSKTGLPIVSLYGKNKKPKPEQLDGIELMVFDIQDVGARFYTYLSTLHYLMEACAEGDIPLIVLDRPNPNGHYIDGPVLEEGFRSFIGMHTIPVVHGMTLGELAQMLNGEGWLKNGANCKLKVIECSNYTHTTPYFLPISPSPNLPSDGSIAWYPSLCFFEGTIVSVGRGTPWPFEVIGIPNGDVSSFSFTPKPIKGAAPYPKHEGKECSGIDFRNKKPATDKLELSYLIETHKNYTGDEPFFSAPSFFDQLAGNSQLRESILAGESEEQIRASWKDGLSEFAEVRSRYLLYPDF